MYLAILTDTGSFHFSHLSPRTYEIARRCVEAGADPQWIATTHYDSNSLARVRIFGAVMNAMEVADDGRVALLSITRKVMADLGGTNDDLEGLINFPLTVKDIEAVAFFKEVGEQDWRVSLRSKGSVDTGAIARQFSGGGHTNASGCSAQGRPRRGHGSRFGRCWPTPCGTSDVLPLSPCRSGSRIQDPEPQSPTRTVSSSSTRPRGRPRTTSSSLRAARSASRASGTPARSIRWRPACCRW